MKIQKLLILPLVIGIFACSDDGTDDIDCATSGLTLSASGQDATTCANGAEVILTGTGGEAPLTYSFGETSFASANSFSGVNGGLTYVAIVKDANDCEASINVTVAEAVSTVTVSLAMTKTGCTTSVGTITVTAGGGDGSYMYQLDGGTAVSDPVFTELASGTYEVTVTDGTGCMTNESIDVIAQDGVTVSLAIADSGCGTSEGMITVTASGGDGNYTYQLGGAAAVTENVFSGLAEGDFQVTVADGSGCETTESVTIMNGISYDASIKAIIQNSCATSGCHVSGGNREDFTDFATIQANAAGIKSRTASGNMPAGGGSLTDAEIEMIACWVNDGALNN